MKLCKHHWAFIGSCVGIHTYIYIHACMCMCMCVHIDFYTKPLLFFCQGSLSQLSLGEALGLWALQAGEGRLHLRALPRGPRGRINWSEHLRERPRVEPHVRACVRACVCACKSLRGLCVFLPAPMCLPSLLYIAHSVGHEC